MDRSHLASLYESGKYADCIIVSGQGVRFKAHRFVLSQHEQLAELIADDDHHVYLTESTEVTERLLRWVYGVEWPDINIELTRAGLGDELMEILSVCDAAEKYEIPKLGDEAYDTLGKIINQISSAEIGLEVLRDLTDKDSGARALQRTIIDRVASLLPGAANTAIASATSTDAAAGVKRKRSVGRPRKIKAEETDLDEDVAVLNRPERAKTPTAKAREAESQPKKQARKSTPARASRAATPGRKSKSTSKRAVTPRRVSAVERHCVCKRREDQFLVQCEGCQLWFHPGCVGKGQYKDSSYKLKRKHAFSGDEKMYREKGLRFTCLECDEHED